MLSEALGIDSTVDTTLAHYTRWAFHAFVQPVVKPLPDVNMQYCLIYETVHGSQAYGLARQGSDVDLKGVCVGPRDWYFGFRGGPEQVELSPDHVIYELRKFMRLAAASNPSLLETLFTRPEHHRHVSPAGERLLAARQQFLSQRAGASFTGYALSQLKRIRSHRRWLLEPPKGAPEREAFGLPEKRLLPRDQLQAAQALEERGQLSSATPSADFLEAIRRERSYGAALRNWQQYRAWKRNRNPARAALEAQFGYDTKHAQHLVRLLRMGLEILRSGTVHVHRHDREELLAIRAGSWSYDALLAHAEALQAEVPAAVASSPLPESPDVEALDRLCVQIVEEVLRAG